MDIRQNQLFQFARFYLNFWAYSTALVILIVIISDNYKINWEWVAISLFFFFYSIFAYANLWKTVRIMCFIILAPLILTLAHNQLDWSDLTHKLPLCLSAVVAAYIGKFFVYLFKSVNNYLSHKIKLIGDYINYKKVGVKNIFLKAIRS